MPRRPFEYVRHLSEAEDLYINLASNCLDFRLVKALPEAQILNLTFPAVSAGILIVCRYEMYRKNCDRNSFVSEGFLKVLSRFMSSTVGRLPAYGDAGSLLSREIS